MHALRFVLSMALVVTLVGAASAEEKKATNKEKIVGTWELVKAATTDKMNVLPPVGANFEFTKDGKVKVSAKVGDKVVDGGEGKYEVDGDTLKLILAADKIETSKIKTLTDKVLVVEDKNGDKSTTMEFKKM